MRRTFVVAVSFCIVAVLLTWVPSGTALAASQPSAPSATQKTSKPLPPALDPRTYQHPSYDAAGLLTIRQTKLANLKQRPAAIIRPNYVSATNYPVLFIHGISNSSSADCSEWNPAKSYLPGQGWSGHLASIKYYTNDTHCDVSITGEASHCTGYHDSGSSDGTNNEDVRHVACEFSWYIWDNYTQYGQNVQVVAHSMGGLITRWALYATPFEPALPPYLLIQDVVTMGTPHYGAPPAYAFFYCGSCLQGSQIETAMPFMQELINSGQNPQGSAGTDWTMLGSTCDIANTLVGNDTEWMTSGHKVLFSSPCYDHGGYMGDTSNTWDASEQYCDFCGTHLSRISPGPVPLTL